MGEQGELFHRCEMQDLMILAVFRAQRVKQGVLKEVHVILQKQHNHYLNLLGIHSNKSKMAFYSQSASNVFIHAHHISYFH